MRNFITPVGEEYPFGGPGKFILGTVQAMAEQLRLEYANTVDLIYIDPPFGTGDGFSVKLPGVREKVKIPAYSDNMDTASYLEMMCGVLTLCHDLLKDTGSIYVHIDYRMCAHTPYAGRNIRRKLLPERDYLGVQKRRPLRAPLFAQA